MDYAAPVYSNIINSLDTKLNKLLNSSLRFVYSLKRSQHITPFRRRAVWLTAKNRRLYFTLINIFVLLISRTPIPLASFLPPLPYNSDPNSHKDQYISRNQTALYTRLPKPSIDLLRDSFIYFSLQELEKLPFNIKNSTSIDNFKSSLFSYLFLNDLSWNHFPFLHITLFILLFLY